LQLGPNKRRFASYKLLKGACSMIYKVKLKKRIDDLIYIVKVEKTNLKIKGAK
jgi:hypothetical protein